MNRRIQQALDGELSVRELSEREAADLRMAEALLAGALGGLPSQGPPDTWPQVRRRIRELRARSEPASPAGKRALGSLLGWLWTPRPFAIAWRPAYALAAAGILVAAMATRGGIGNRADAGAPRTAGAATQQVLVQFRLEAPHASQVMLAGGFTEWRPAYTLQRSEAGVWTIVVPLDPGIHDYAFVVDGERWVPDPFAPPVADGFGGVNSRVAVLAPDSQRPL